MKVSKYFISSAGIFPIIVGLYQYFKYFSFTQINILEHVAFTNLFAMGVVTLCLGLMVEREELKLFRLLLGMFALSWTAGNDAFMSLRFFFSPYAKIYFFPFPMFPLVLGSIGLFFHAHALRYELPRASLFVKISIPIVFILVISSVVYAVNLEKQGLASLTRYGSSEVLDSSMRTCPALLKRECCVDKNCKKVGFCEPQSFECHGQKSLFSCYSLQWIDSANTRVNCNSCSPDLLPFTSLKTYTECPL